MNLPRNLTTCMFAVLAPLAFIACNRAEDEPPIFDDPAPAETPAPAPAEPPATDMGPMTAQLTPLNDTGITGEIEVRAEGNRTQVTTRLSGAPPNVTHAGHIHSGTCANIGGVVAPLESIETRDDGTGESTSTVEIAPMTLMDGQHVVAYHTAAGQPATCAAIPGHRM